MTDGRSYTWIVRAPGGADGVVFARGRSAPLDRILVHAPPPVIDVEVFEDGERLVATGTDLRADDHAGPIQLLTVDGERVTRSPVDPVDEPDEIVLLGGGEIGTLTSWEWSEDRSRWRWSVRFDGGRA